MDKELIFSYRRSIAPTERDDAKNRFTGLPSFGLADRLNRFEPTLQ